MKLPTQDRALIPLHTLAPVGTFTLSYASRSVSRGLEILLFLLAIGLGYWLIFKAGHPHLWVCVGIIAVPGLFAWFADRGWREVFESGVTGGVSFCALLALLYVVARIKVWRENRLALAPDPFIEDAGNDESAPAPSPNPEPAPDPEVGEDSKLTDEDVVEESEDDNDTNSESSESQPTPPPPPPRRKKATKAKKTTKKKKRNGED